MNQFMQLCCCLAFATAAAAETPFFSENFDGGKWAPGDLKQGALPGIAIVTEPVASAPHALQVSRVSAPAMTDVRFASPTPADRDLAIRFKLRLAPKSRADLALLSKQGKSLAALCLRSGQKPLVKGSGPWIPCQELPAIEDGKWLEFEIVVSAQGRSFTLAQLDGGKRIGGGAKAPLDGALPGIGLRFFNSPNGGSGFYDDITVTTSEAAAVQQEKPTAAGDYKRIIDHLNSPVPEYWRWVFYGDSITHGVHATKGFRSYSELFNECLRYECGFPRRKDVVINSGISGHSTVNLAPDANYVPMVQALKPNVVFLMIGANDIVVPGMTVEKFRDALGGMVDRVRSDGAIPVLQTFNTMLKIADTTADWQKDYLRRYEEFPAYNQAIRDVAAQHDCLLVDHYRHWEKEAADLDVLKSWMYDELHPGARGHYEMAKVLLEFFKMGGPNSRVLKTVPPPLGGK